MQSKMVKVCVFDMFPSETGADEWVRHIEMSVFTFLCILSSTELVHSNSTSEGGKGLVKAYQYHGFVRENWRGRE